MLRAAVDVVVDADDDDDDDDNEEEKEVLDKSKVARVSEVKLTLASMTHCVSMPTCIRLLPYHESVKELF